MKKISFAVIALLLMLCVFTFTACGGESGDSGDSRPELTLTTNIEGAGTVTGGGHFDYNEDLNLAAASNDGYYFLGWYYGEDLLSTYAEYNCKMWDKDVTLEAKFTALPKDYNGSLNGGDLGEDTNMSFLLHVKTDTPLLGQVDVGDAGNQTAYKVNMGAGDNIKALAFTNSSKRFLGWFDDADNLVMANAVFEFAMPAFDYTLSAKWECNEENLVYNVDERLYICTNCGGIGTPDGNNDFAVIDGEKGKTLVSYLGNEINITIPSNIVSIAKNAFRDSRNIKSIIVPNTVTSIENGAFNGCSSLESITLPYVNFEVDGIVYPFGYIFGNSKYTNSITIEQYKESLKDGTDSNAFYQLPSTLNSVTINGSEIYERAFYNCANLKSVTIGRDITSIGSSAFYGCENLENVYISDLTAWYNISFGGKSSNPLYQADNFYLNGELVTDLVIPDSITSIGSCAFSGYTRLASVTIPNSVTSIGDDAFYGCTNLTSITIPDSVTSIGKFAFYECTGLTSVTIGNSITNIGSEAFQGCLKLIEVVNRSSLNISKKGTSNGYVGYYAIEVHSGESKLVSYNDYLFYTCDGKNLLVGYVGDDTELVFPESYNGENYEICPNAFYEHNFITSVTISDGVTSLGNNAFRYCTNLTSVIIGNSVTNIDYCAFEGCTSISNLTIGNKVSSIGNRAFRGCASLARIIIPNGVANIGVDVFENCSSLTIYCEAARRPSGWNSSWNDSNCPVVWGYEGDN